MMLKTKYNLKELLGIGVILCSTVFFYLSTATINWSKEWVSLDPAMFVFGRFFLGFFIISAIMMAKKQKPVVNNFHLIFGRMITNCFAVFFFFKAVDVTSVANGNILNMTYPLFVALFSWVLFKDQRDKVLLLVAIISFVGIWLTISPNIVEIDIKNLWGLASGSIAGVSIIYLNRCRQYHDSETILLFVFGLGSLVILAVFFNDLKIPNGQEMIFLVLCALFGVGGQYTLTFGFKFVSAVEGGIISSSRILLAAMLGPFLAMEPFLGLTGWIGAILIFGCNVYLTIRKARMGMKKEELKETTKTDVKAV